MSDQTPQFEKWILSPPGGPAGPFWGIVTQSGRLIALQIVEKTHAEMFRIVGELVNGGDDREIVDRFLDALDHSNINLNHRDWPSGGARSIVSIFLEVILGKSLENDE